MKSREAPPINKTRIAPIQEPCQRFMITSLNKNFVVSLAEVHALQRPSQG
jgi:hypothetical protein